MLLCWHIILTYANIHTPAKDTHTHIHVYVSNGKLASLCAGRQYCVALVVAMQLHVQRHQRRVAREPKCLLSTMHGNASERAATPNNRRASAPPHRYLKVLIAHNAKQYVRVLLHGCALSAVLCLIGSAFMQPMYSC